ncbi:hypothetical protein ACP4OV_000069 [Aristida adscensionis]
MDAAGQGRGTIFPVPQIPALPFPPPPPPPPLPTYHSYSSYTSHHPSITNFPILLLTVLGIVTTSVLLLAYYVFVIRCCLNWHSSSNVSSLIARRRGRPRGGAASTSSSSLPVTGAPAEPRGLEESTIQALPTFRYRKAIKNAADSAPSSECAVCLSEFEEHESVRMLPSCLHVFHVDCIDTWLQGNANCPLCRTAINSHCQLPLDQLQRPEEVVIQVTTGTVEEGTEAQQQDVSMRMAAAESAGDTTTDQHVNSERAKSNNAWHDIEISSKGDECMAARKDRDVVPLRRSFSMSSLGGREIHLQIHNILQRNIHFHGDGSDSSSSSNSSRIQNVE